jgi:DnaJ-like protein
MMIGSGAVVSIDGATAAMGIGIGLALTLLVGMASQILGRRPVRRAKTRTIPTPPPPTPSEEQQEDLDAVNRGIETARSELRWLRDQVAKERARLENVRRQQAPEPAPAPFAPDNPWTVLGLAPGASPDEVRHRFRLLSRVWHPDRFTDGPAELRAEAEAMMARLNRAHQTLLENHKSPSRR